MKKLISILLTLILLISIIPSVFAEEISINEIVENNFTINALTPKELKDKIFTINDDFSTIWDTMTKYQLIETKIYIKTENEKEFYKISDEIISESFRKYFHQKYPYYAMEFDGICQYYSSSLNKNNINYLKIKLVHTEDRTDKQLIEDYQNTLKFCKETVIDWYNNDLNINASNEEKMKYVYNWMIDFANYDYSLKNYRPSDIIKNKKGICQNITAIYNLLLRYMNIDTLCVTGTASREPHAWTEVITENENKYIDVTWGETFSKRKRIDYQWFLTTKKYMENCRNRRIFD